MPSMANITVKKANGTTDVTYIGVSQSSSDGSPAVWKNKTVGSAPGHQPEVRVVAKEAARGTKREIRITARYPQLATNSTTGLTTVADAGTFTGTFLWPKTMAQTEIDEFAAQITNVVASQLIKACVSDGYSAS